MGKWTWVAEVIEMKWFLNVLMCLSAGFARWFRGGTYCTRGEGLRDLKKAVRREEDSLSETMSVMGWPWEAKKERVALNAPT